MAGGFKATAAVAAAACGDDGVERCSRADERRAIGVFSKSSDEERGSVSRMSILFGACSRIFVDHQLARHNAAEYTTPPTTVSSAQLVVCSSASCTAQKHEDAHAQNQK